MSDCSSRQTKGTKHQVSGDATVNKSSVINYPPSYIIVEESNQDVGCTSPSLGLMRERQTLRASFLHLIRLVPVRRPRNCRVEVMLMKGKRCLFPRDRERKEKKKFLMCAEEG